MKNIKLASIFILAGLSLLWWWADPLVVESNTFFAVRASDQYSAYWPWAS